MNNAVGPSSAVESGAAIDLTALRKYLAGQNVDVSAELTAELITTGRSNLTFKVSDGITDWIVRRPPLAGLTPSAHDVGREYKVIDALQDTSVPVARTIANCADESVMGTPFTVVSFIPGEVLRTQKDVAGLTDDDILNIHRELIRVLVALHAIPYADLGLKNLGRPAGFYQRQVRRWRQQWDHVRIEEINDVDRLYQQLTKRDPVSGRGTLVHGDYRIDNTLLDSTDVTRILGLVDWEMSTIGDPVTDVATMCAYQHPAFDFVVGEPAASTSDRWPDVAEIAEDYATSSGRDLSQFAPYLGLAYFKLAVIAAGIASRYVAGAGDGPGFETARLAVRPLLAAGLEVLEAQR